MGVLTLRKVTIPRNLVVHSDSDNNDLPLVRHDAQVDLNPDGARIHYTQEPVLLVESPMSNPPPYIIAGHRTGVGLGNYLFQTPIIRERVIRSQSDPTRHQEWSSVVLPRSVVRLGQWSIMMMTLRRKRMKPPVR
jgi:hypothetical protein